MDFGLYSAQNELVGIAPLYRFVHGQNEQKDDGGRSETPPELIGKSQLSIIGGTEVCDYLDLIIACRAGRASLWSAYPLAAKQ